MDHVSTFAECAPERQAVPNVVIKPSIAYVTMV
jgi:hypothetical protein